MGNVRTDPRKNPPHCTFLAARLNLIMFFGITDFEPCFKSFNFYQNKLKIMLFLPNNTNFSSAGAPPPDPQSAPFPLQISGFVLDTGRRLLKLKKKLYETNSSAFLNELCECFANIGANMCKNLLNSVKADLKLVIHSKSCIQSFVFHEITKEEVTRHINAMKTHTAPGLDGISSKFIDLTKLIVAPFLVQLFYNCIDQNIFPENIKLAIVTPIPKTSSPKSMNDFRPISLLPIFSKIFEKIIAERVMSFIDKNSILTSSQFGFRTSSSTELAVTSIYDELLQHLDDNKLTCSFF